MYLTKRHISNLNWQPVDGYFQSEFVFKFDNGVILNKELEILKEGYEYKAAKIIDAISVSERNVKILVGFFDGRRLVKALVKERKEYLLKNKKGVIWVADLSTNKFFVISK